MTSDAKRPTLAFVLPIEGSMRVVSNLTNEAETNRLLDWLGRDEHRADIISTFVREMGALDDDRPGS